MTAYQSAMDHKPRHASTDTLLAALASLSFDITKPDQAATRLKALAHDQRQQRLEPVYVATANRKPAVTYTLPPSRSGSPKATGKLKLELHLDTGETHTQTVNLADCKLATRKLHDASTVHTAKLHIDRKAPMGYHTLHVTHASRTDSTLLIAAPTVSYQVDDNPNGDPLKSLGLFCPTYAIRTDDNLGCGNLTNLNDLARWAHTLGCDLISTLPLLAAFNDDSPLHEPAPYSPVSRRFWNELFLDLSQAPNFQGAKQARRHIASAAFKRAQQKLIANTDRVDYRATANLQRPALDKLAAHFFDNNLDKSPEFRAYIKHNPLAKSYALFRAVCEQRETPWDQWPARLRNGNLRAADADTAVAQRHLYAQFATSQQLAAFSDDMAERGSRLYLDLAIGVHPQGFDVWNNQDAYMLGTSVGAPPDPMFTSGQSWGFPALNPNTVRAQGYTEVIDAIRTHTDHAHFLRLDHVMGFHRLFLIPPGLTASDGVYLRYREDELFAILSLESHRAQTRLIGENLGTVPDVVEKRMTKHKVGKLYVGEFEGRDNPKRAMTPVPRNVAASLNTHDLPTFIMHHTAKDIPQRIAAGVFNPDLADAEVANRLKAAASIEKWLHTKGATTSKNPKPTAVAHALYQYLAESDAELALINIEDLWGETHWQNIPGTTIEHDNWQHKLAKTLDEIKRSPKLKATLKDLAQRRAGDKQTF